MSKSIERRLVSQYLGRISDQAAEIERLKTALREVRHVMEMAVLKYRDSLGLHVSYQQALLELDRFAWDAAQAAEKESDV